MAHRIVFQIVAISSRVLGRAVTEAWRQASAAQAYKSSSTSSSSSSSSSSSTALRAHHGLTLSEACEILNVKQPKIGQGGIVEEEVDMEQVMERFKRLFDANEPERGGSFYLQSKILRARERIEGEVRRKTAREEEERVPESWKPKVWKDEEVTKK